MFIPKVFRQTNIDIIEAFINTHPLATVVAHTDEGLEASHVPMLWVKDKVKVNTNDNSPKTEGYLLGHIAKVNALNSECALKTPWLFIFQDAGHYISPNWYPSKALTHKEVPTWNYRSVHISGRVTLLTKAEDLIDILHRLTQTFEVAQPIPWTLNDAPDNYIQGLCRAIVGIRVDVIEENVKAQFKLSQNKSLENRVGVVAGLKRLETVEADKMASLIDVE